MASPGARFDFASDDPPGHCWYLPETARPPRVRTQWLAFRLRLHDFVAHSPASHFAIVLRARLGFDADGRAVSISGRGMTFGDTSQARPADDDPHASAAGFGGARGAQVESFWPGGNFLYQAASVLPAGIEDDVDYTIELRVDDERRIEIGVSTPDGAWQRARIQDRAEHPVISQATGVLVGIGRGPGESGAWRAELRDIETGWSARLSDFCGGEPLCCAPSPETRMSNSSHAAPPEALPPPPDPRPNLLQSRWLVLLFGLGVLLILLGLALRVDVGLLLQRAGCFLATYAVLIGAAWLPAGVLSRRVDAVIERWVRNSSGGFYGVMALSVFVQLEAVALVQRVVEFEPTVGELRKALIEHLIGFSQDSVMSFVWGMAWPGRLLRDHGGPATAAFAVAAWLVFRLSQRFVPHAVLQKRAPAAA